MDSTCLLLHTSLVEYIYIEITIILPNNLERQYNILATEYFYNNKYFQ